MRFSNIYLIALLLGFGGITLVSGTSCGPRVVYVRTAPPPPKVETKPPRPSANAVWVPGHWKWNGREYVWISGHWELHPKGAVWVPGHWKRTPHGWKWVPGHWKK